MQHTVCSKWYYSYSMNHTIITVMNHTVIINHEWSYFLVVSRNQNCLLNGPIRFLKLFSGLRSYEIIFRNLIICIRGIGFKLRFEISEYRIRDYWTCLLPGTACPLGGSVRCWGGQIAVLGPDRYLSIWAPTSGPLYWIEFSKRNTIAFVDALNAFLSLGFLINKR